jgi:DNA invertase Pin-like site-specific DNA recombinase
MAKRSAATTPPADVCVIYCRVSSPKQAAEDKASLDEQERHGRDKAAELGLNILYVRRDAESAWVLDSRSKFEQVLADTQARRFGVLIVDRMNRFTRSENISDYFAVQNRLDDLGVRVIFSTRDYPDSPTGQLQKAIDAYVSGQEQYNRRMQMMQGKRNRVALGRPMPGGNPLYGYRWADAKKTRMIIDPGPAQAVVRRIWNMYLHDDHPTVRGIAMTLNREGVPTPKTYWGVQGPKRYWTGATIRELLLNEVYWGGTGGRVQTFLESKENPPTEIPAYAPPYVTPEEAERVRNRMRTNQRYAKRHRIADWNVLLYGGMARCGLCSGALDVHPHTQLRADGSRLVLYRCRRNSHYGKSVCPGVSISATTLDHAILAALDDQLNRGDFLQRVFDAWKRDENAAASGVAALEKDLQDTERKVSNLAARLADYGPDDPAAAPVELTMRMYAEQLPSMRSRLDSARQAVTRARADHALHAELREWMAAWAAGFSGLTDAKRRQFLESLNAEVRLWPADARTPRAVLTLALPSTTARALPAPPPIELPLDLKTGEQLGEMERLVQRELEKILHSAGLTPEKLGGETYIAVQNESYRVFEWQHRAQAIVTRLTESGAPMDHIPLDAILALTQNEGTISDEQVAVLLRMAQQATNATPPASGISPMVTGTTSPSSAGIPTPAS